LLETTKKFDYISILAGGSCKFNCSFCVGNNIRKDVTPHFSKKWRSFLECFCDMTDLLSISGDTSDPSFIRDRQYIPELAKAFNPKIKITIHTRNIEYTTEAIKDGYDKCVFSIDEDFFDTYSDASIIQLQKIQQIKNKLRFSIVLTLYNFGYFIEDNGMIERLVSIFPNAQITLRPEISESEHIVNCLEGFGTWADKDNGAQYLEGNPNIWLWDYSKTNKKLNVRYLFSTGEISSNRKWDNLVSS